MVNTLKLRQRVLVQHGIMISTVRNQYTLLFQYHLLWIYNFIYSYSLCRLLHEIAFIESALDDPEHISLDGYPQKLREIVDNEYVEIDDLLKTSDNGRILKEGVSVASIAKVVEDKTCLLYTSICSTA